MEDLSKITRKNTQDNYVTEKFDVIENNLLGTYDEDGEYVLAPQIIQELLKLKKVKKSTFGNSVYCISNLLGYGELVFELVFDEKTRNKKSASATLYLLEDVYKINGYLQNTMKSRIDEYNHSVDDFIEETYKYFNISSDEEDDDSEVLEKKLDEDLNDNSSYILAKKQFSLMLYKLTGDKILDAYGKYFTARISALTKIDNGFSRAVLESFNHQYELIQNVFLKEKNYEVLNELLDKCIEEKSGLNSQFIIEEQEFANKVQPALETFINSVENINDKFENRAINALNKDDMTKVKTIFDSSKDIDLPDPKTLNGKQSIEQIINSVQQSTIAKEEKVVEDKQSEEKEVVEEEKVEMVEPVQEESVSNEVNFYNNFKQNYFHQNASSKVVDTSISREIEESETETNDFSTISSLKDRMNRLEKFKKSKAMSDYEKNEESDEMDK